MLQRLLLITLTLCSLSASAQWQQTGSKVRYVNGLGIPTKDTAVGVSADSSQIVIRPADSSLYVKYKRTWLRVGGGGGSIAGSGTINRVAKFTSTSAIGNSLLFDNGTAIGIGTLTPTTTLQVGDGTANPEITASGLNYDVVLGTPSGSALGFTTTGNYVGVYSNSATKDLAFTHGNSRAITFGTGNQSRLTITASGRLLANTRTDNGVDQLQVNGSGMFSNSVIASSSTVGGNLGDVNNFIATNSNTTVGNFTGYLFNHGDINANNKFGYIGTIITSLATNGLADMVFGVKANTSAVNITEYMRIKGGGRILINTPTDNGVDQLQVSGTILSTQYKLSALNTAPATASSTGTLGEIRIDANYIYICTATNTWKRVSIATW